MHTDKYIERLSLEISDLIERESKGLTWEGEQRLHVLLENYKHAMKWMKHKGENAAKMNAATEDPSKSFFGVM